MFIVRKMEETEQYYQKRYKWGIYREDGKLYAPHTRYSTKAEAKRMAKHFEEIKRR